MALTKEQILSLINENEEIKKIFELFKANNLNTITSNYSVAEESMANVCFLEAYREELDKFLENGGNHLNVNSPEFRAAMDDMGLVDFSDIYGRVEDVRHDPEKSPLSDPTLTEAQRQGLKDFHKWLYRNADKTGFIGLGNDGSMRDFANNFMKQPAAVQLKALYLLQTGKRKNPDNSGLDDVTSQLSYVPDLNKIKKPLIASKWKFWKRTNGTQFYWDKLSDSLNQAMESEAELGELRDTMVQADADEKGQDDYIKNGFGDKAYLKALDKIIENDNFEKEDGTIDEKKKKFIKGMRDSLRITLGLNLEEETKRKAIDQIYGLLGVKAVNTDKTATLKGMGDYVQSGILDHEDNYYNLEYAMQSVLLTLSEDAAFEEAPTLRELISNHPLSEIPGAAFDGLAFVGDIVSLVNNAKDFAKSFKNGGVLQGISNKLDMAENIADAGYRATALIEKGAELFDASEEFVDAVGNYGDMCFGAYNVITTVNSTVNAIEAGINKSKVTKAEENIKNISDVDTKKDVKNIAEVSRFMNEKKQHTAVRGIVKGGIATAMSFGSAAIGAVPVVGQVMLAGVVGLSVYDQVKEEKNRRSISRKVVDNLVIGKKKIGEMAEKFVDKLKKKLNHYDKNSAEYKKISAMIKNEDKAKDKIRNEEAVKQGNTSLFSSTSSIMENLGEKMLKQVYLIDSNGEFTEDNLITAENKDEVYKKHKEKISYKDLLESTGQTVKFEKKSNIIEKGLKKYENEIKDKVSKQITK